MDVDAPVRRAAVLRGAADAASLPEGEAASIVATARAHQAQALLGRGPAELRSGR